MRACALILGFALGGCGGGSGGVASTPPPTTAASYTKIIEMSGDRTFQSAGVQYSQVPGGFANGTAQALGSGVTVAYLSASDSYRLTAPDGVTVTFTPADVVSQPSTTPNTLQWSKRTATGSDSFTLTVPTSGVGGVALNYMVFGSWSHTEGANTIGRLAVGGQPTIATDMPRTGSATYSVSTGGGAVQGGTIYSLNGNSSATFSANFGNNSVATSLTLGGTTGALGTTVTQLGTFNGTGTISATGPGFTGTLSGNNANGVFSGAFFGPQAAEVGYDWVLSGSNFGAVGAVVGAK